MKKASFVVLIALSAVAFSACTGVSNEESQVESQEVVTSLSEKVIPQEIQEEVTEPIQEYDVSMDNYSYSQTILKVKAGEEITINLTNNEGNHDLVIDELDVHSEHLAKGQSEQLTFTVGEEHIGKTYEFYCSVGRHRQLGMIGTIEIVR